MAVLYHICVPKALDGCSISYLCPQGPHWQWGRRAEHCHPRETMGRVPDGIGSQLPESRRGTLAEGMPWLVAALEALLPHSSALEWTSGRGAREVPSAPSGGHRPPEVLVGCARAPPAPSRHPHRVRSRGAGQLGLGEGMRASRGLPQRVCSVQEQAIAEWLVDTYIRGWRVVSGGF